MSGVLTSLAGILPASGGSPAWTYSQLVGDLDTTYTSDPAVFIYQAITLTAGTASKLSVYVVGCGVSDVKIALYDGSKNLLANGVVASPNDAGNHDLEVTISDTAVSAATYYVGFCPEFAALGDIKYRNGAGTRLYKLAVVYGSFPNDPIGEDGSQSNSHRVGVYITP